MADNAKHDQQGSRKSQNGGQQRQDATSIKQRADADVRPNAGGNDPRASIGDAGQGPSTSGTLSSGYSSRSSAGGTGGGVLNQRGSGYSPGEQSRTGTGDNESDELARDGVAAGASGMGADVKRAGRDHGSSNEDEESADASRTIGGVAGVSGGGSGTTSSGSNKR